MKRPSNFPIFFSISHYVERIYGPKKHYEIFCLRQLDYLTTKVPKQLICNCIAIVPWKYDKLINKMPHQKIKELYYSYKLVARCIFIQYNVHIVYKVIVNDVDFVDKLHFSYM
jgi:hypothetical protein